MRAVGYGHLGDANLHLNLYCPKHTDEITAAIEPYVFDRVAALKGSVSAGRHHAPRRALWWS